MNMYNSQTLLNFRREKDKHWREDEQSPLTKAQRKEFRELNYFLPNPNLNFELLLDTNIPGIGKEVIINTTGGDKQIYKKAGKVRFRVGDQEVEAYIYEDPKVEQYQYYLLFKDQTTGKETYENGRMLQIEKKGNKLVVDFNYTYNPYSSYNDNWDCPIVPEENHLLVRIEGGEKKFA